MSLTLETATSTFTDRRASVATDVQPKERRQFSNSYAELTAEGRELATAIDSYKATHRRRFISYDEMLSVIQSVGYHK